MTAVNRNAQGRISHLDKEGSKDPHHHHLTRKSRIFSETIFKTSLSRLPFSPGGPTLPGRPGAPFSPFSPASPVDKKVNKKKNYIKPGLFSVSSVTRMPFSRVKKIEADVI